MDQPDYKVEYTYSSKNDLRNMKKYILDNFKYRELGENFSKKMKKAVSELKSMPKAHNTTGFRYREYEIYFKPYQSYLFFYIVDELQKKIIILRVMQDGMNWKYVLQVWLRRR